MADRVKLYKQPQGVPVCISLDMYTNVNQQEQSAESLPNKNEAQGTKASYSSEMIQSTWKIVVALAVGSGVLYTVYIHISMYDICM